MFKLVCGGFGAGVVPGKEEPGREEEGLPVGQAGWVCNALGEDVLNDLVLNGGEGGAETWGYLDDGGAGEVGDGAPGEAVEEGWGNGGGA